MPKTKRMPGDARKSTHGVPPLFPSAAARSIGSAPQTRSAAGRAAVDHGTVQPGPTLRDNLIETVRRVESGAIQPVLVSGTSAEDRLRDILASVPNRRE